MTQILLDTNAYLRLAKRVRPCLGVPFHKTKQYVLLVLPEVQKEVERSPRLSHLYPWFFNDPHPEERTKNSVRIPNKDKEPIKQWVEFIKEWVARNTSMLIQGGRSPPGSADCYVLAVAKHYGWMVATDDEGMHFAASQFEIKVLYCYDVLHKLWSSKTVDGAKVIEIYAALEANRDLPARWLQNKEKFGKVFPNKAS